MSASSCASSEVDTRGELKADTKGCGDIVSKDDPLDILLGFMLVSAELTLVDRPWVLIFCEVSILALRAATTLFVDWPRPSCCGRAANGDDRLGMGLGDDKAVNWAVLVGEMGLCGGDKA